MAKSKARMEQEQAEEEAKRKAVTAKVSAATHPPSSGAPTLSGAYLSCVCSQVMSRHRIVTPGRRDTSPHPGGGDGPGSTGGGGGLQLPKAKRRPTPRGI